MNVQQKLPALCLITLVTIISGCEKTSTDDPIPTGNNPTPSGHNLTQAGYHIKVVSGNGQSDSIGNVLPNQLVFSLSVNGQPPSSGSVKFETLNCDGNPQYQQHPLLPSAAPGDSLVDFQWMLNATVGLRH
jgi:hypothetical protein